MYKRQGGVGKVTPNSRQSRYEPVAGQAKQIGDPTDDQGRNEQDGQYIKQDCDHKVKQVDRRKSSFQANRSSGVLMGSGFGMHGKQNTHPAFSTSEY